ncbi:MAG: hypothetical protein ACI93S_001633, partial [Ancylomarina sp.]
HLFKKNIDSASRMSQKSKKMAHPTYGWVIFSKCYSFRA